MTHTALAFAVSIVAPYYNLLFAMIAIFFFIKLFVVPMKTKVFLLPWKLLFVSFLVYLVEEIFTVLRKVGVLDIPIHINGFFELVIISVFIYALLLQKEYIKKNYKT